MIATTRAQSVIPQGATPTTGADRWDDQDREVIALEETAGGWLAPVFAAHECLDGAGTADGCTGAVRVHFIGASLRGWPRCERHAEEREAAEERRQERYPDSPVAPSWFSEEAAGERWDEES